MEITRNHLRGYWEPPTLSVFFCFEPNRIPSTGSDLVALSRDLRTITSMNNDDLLNYPPISPEIEAFLEKYRPRDRYSRHWERFRPQILDLIRKAAPTTVKKTSALLWALGYLLADPASSNFEGSLDELLTGEGIERSVVRLNSKNVARQSIHSVRASLVDLHRVLNDLPCVIFSEPQVRRASDPVSLEEIEKILEYLKHPTLAIHLHITRCFILALGAGLIGEKADEARIFFSDQGISSIVDRKGNRRPLSKKWIALLGTLTSPDLELYKVPQAQATRTWLLRKSLPYLMPRLRDEWLLEQLDGSEPAFVQFRRSGVTQYDLGRLVLSWNQVSAADANNLLRNSKKYIPAECARLTSEHRLHQDLNKGV